MGNTIKNFEKKRRKEQKEAQREVRQLVASKMAECLGYAADLAERREEAYIEKKYHGVYDKDGFPKV